MNATNSELTRSICILKSPNMNNFAVRSTTGLRWQRMSANVILKSVCERFGYLYNITTWKYPFWMLCMAAKMNSHDWQCNFTTFWTWKYSFTYKASPWWGLFTDSFSVSSNLINLNLLRAKCTFSSLLHNLDSAKPITYAANTFGSNSMSLKCLWCLCKDLTLLNAILILPGPVLYKGT